MYQGFPITCFLWDKLGHRLFSACNAGLVCQTALRAGMSALFGSTDTELLLKEETGIVQVRPTFEKLVHFLEPIRCSPARFLCS